jgi:hypothetical protein
MSTIPKTSTADAPSEADKQAESKSQSSNHAVADLEPSSEKAEEQDDLIMKTASGTIIYPTVLSIGTWRLSCLVGT